MTSDHCTDSIQGDVITSSEGTPLLPQAQRRQNPNPLPWFQILVVLLLQFCEPLTAQSIYPYINQLVSELDITGGDKRKVGYYVGLIDSLFFVTQASTVFQWNRISDYIGRKPVMLIGLFGTSASMLSFGLSRTFLCLIISRCLSGLLDGSIGVMKSAIGELTDSSNRAEGFAMIPVAWAAGVTLGPLIGGTFSRPHEHFPGVFQGIFWEKYPYFLPCAITSTFVVATFAIVFFFFKETAPKYGGRHGISHPESISTLQPPLPLSSLARDEPIPIHRLLVYPVIISVLNYMSLAFLNIALVALLPLFFATPIEIGGLGFSPATIGYIMGSFGMFSGIFQAFFFAKIIRYLGERRTFLCGMSTFLPIFTLFPIMNIYAQSFGLTAIVWVCIAMMLVMMTFMNMAYGCIFIFITASAPNKRSLGATNGLSQMTVSIVRTIGPAMSTSLFAASVEHNLLGGYAVYAIIFGLSCIAILLAQRLPHEMWGEAENESRTS